jgi:hypothetical protein
MADVRYAEPSGFPGYRVGDDGSVWTSKPPNGKGVAPPGWRELKQHRISATGYMSVCLCNGPKWRYTTVHRLVLETFVGPRPKGFVCRHLNGIRADNRLENIRWGTYAENCADAARHGTLIHGTQSKKAKLTEVDIPVIRQLAQRGVSQRAIGEMFGVGQPTISRAVRGLNWRRVP